MASQSPKSLALFLLFINLLMYAIVAAVAGWAINYGIEETSRAGNAPHSAAQFLR